MPFNSLHIFIFKVIFKYTKNRFMHPNINVGWCWKMLDSLGWARKLEPGTYDINLINLIFFSWRTQVLYSIGSFPKWDCHFSKQEITKSCHIVFNGIMINPHGILCFPLWSFPFWKLEIHYALYMRRKARGHTFKFVSYISDKNWNTVSELQQIIHTSHYTQTKVSIFNKYFWIFYFK